jgi:hypothetical protein
MASKKGKETIKPPTKRELADAAKELQKGHSAGGRVLAEQKAAIKQGAASKTPKKKN